MNNANISETIRLQSNAYNREEREREREKGRVRKSNDSFSLFSSRYIRGKLVRAFESEISARIVEWTVDPRASFPRLRCKITCNASGFLREMLNA